MLFLCLHSDDDVHFHLNKQTDELWIHSVIIRQFKSNVCKDRMKLQQLVDDL